jgi:hypothetical protein
MESVSGSPTDSLGGEPLRVCGQAPGGLYGRPHRQVGESGTIRAAWTELRFHAPVFTRSGLGLGSHPCGPEYGSSEPPGPKAPECRYEAKGVAYPRDRSKRPLNSPQAIELVGGAGLRRLSFDYGLAR